MPLKHQELIQSIMYGLSVDSVTDPVIKSVTEADVSTLIKGVVDTKENIDYNNIDPKYNQWIMLKVREELYWKFALASAPLYEITIDGLKVAKQTRFEHYIKLLELLKKQIASIELADPSLGMSTVKTYRTYKDEPYNYEQNKQVYSLPSVVLTVDSSTLEYNNISFSMSSKKHDFHKYEVYYSDKPIYDEYDKDNLDLSKCTIIRSSYSVKDNKFRVHHTLGYVLLIVKLKNGLQVYHELKLGGE